MYVINLNSYKKTNDHHVYEKRSISLIIRELQIEPHTATIKRQKIAIIEDVENRKTLCTIGGKINWYSPLWKTIWNFFKNTKNIITI
jgi:hypothetical protein